MSPARGDLRGVESGGRRKAAARSLRRRRREELRRGGHGRATVTDPRMREAAAVDRATAREAANMSEWEAESEITESSICCSDGLSQVRRERRRGGGLHQLLLRLQAASEKIVLLGRDGGCKGTGQSGLLW